MDSHSESRKDRKKRSGWFKVLDMVLRSCHIGTSSVLVGGLVFAVPFTRLSTWHNLTIATGSALILFNVLKCRHWPYQGRGLMAALHVGLLWFAHVRTEYMVPLLMAVLTIGVVGSHMPALLRHWSVVHRRVLD